MEDIKNFNAEEKLESYKVARDLFNGGSSHPQVIEKLMELGCDLGMANIIAERALSEKWDELFAIARLSFNEGKTYDEVLKILNDLEEDRGITKFITDTWYDVKNITIENTIESPTNLMEGSMWMIIGAIGVFVSFYFKLTIISKIIWSVVFVFSTLQYLYGLKQRSIAKQVKKFMEDEQN
jgi:hypothetical protein